MNILALLDGTAALIVVGGTALATFLRCGLHDIVRTGRRLGAMFAGQTFDPARARARLSRQVMEIQQEGLLRAHPAHVGDSEFDDATDALLANRSIEALLERHETHKARRIEVSEMAVATLVQAAELAPVFGLAGTLVSLSQLSGGAVGQNALAGAIALAVLTTLYGLLLANLVLAPIARRLERHARTEEVDRQAVIDWLASQLASACRPVRSSRAAA
jgi:chemotaxis protein MotA